MLASEASFSSTPYLVSHCVMPACTSDLMACRRTRISAALWVAVCAFGLEILGGGVVARGVLLHARVHDHDVVERVPDDVESLAQRHRLDLAEEHLHADLAGRDDAEDGKEHDERGDADGDGEDGARNDLRQRRRPA